MGVPARGQRGAERSLRRLPGSRGPLGDTGEPEGYPAVQKSLKVLDRPSIWANNLKYQFVIEDALADTRRWARAVDGAGNALPAETVRLMSRKRTDSFSVGMRAVPKGLA